MVLLTLRLWVSVHELIWDILIVMGCIRCGRAAMSKCSEDKDNNKPYGNASEQRHRNIVQVPQIINLDARLDHLLLGGDVPILKNGHSGQQCSATFKN